MSAYEDAIRATATDHAPWLVVPADQKWFTRLVVVAAIDHAIRDLGLKPPQVAADVQARFDEARASLAAEDS